MEVDTWENLLQQQQQKRGETGLFNAKKRHMHVYVIPGANKGKSAFVFVYISQNVWLG